MTRFIDSYGPAYDNIEYFMRRNDVLCDRNNFYFACCNKKCKGYFRDSKSQNNGCRELDQHLFINNNIKTDEFNLSQEEIECIKSHELHINVCLRGKWKMFVYVGNSKSLLKICDIEIIKHTKAGQVEGYLIGTTYIENNKHDEIDNDLEQNIQAYSGQFNDGQLILTYHGKQSYSMQYILDVEDYQLNGSWITTTQTQGTCQWFKIQKIL